VRYVELGSGSTALGSTQFLTTMTLDMSQAGSLRRIEFGASRFGRRKRDQLLRAAAVS
jgi:hypothetical protein